MNYIHTYTYTHNLVQCVPLLLDLSNMKTISLDMPVIYESLLLNKYFLFYGDCKTTYFSSHHLCTLLLLKHSVICDILDSQACVHAKLLQSWIPWTIARQAPLSMGFSRQQYWSGLPCPPPGDSQPRDWNHISCLLQWQVGSLPLAPLGKPLDSHDPGTFFCSILFVFVYCFY